MTNLVLYRRCKVSRMNLRKSTMTQIRPIPFATISFGLLLGLTALPGHSS
jgi:hypothetical protein